MKKTALLVLIINVFLLMVVNIMSDYLSLGDRVSSINDSVGSSVDSAISAVMSSEEFFSSSGAYASSTSEQSVLSVWNGSSFTVGNIYLISFYMTDKGSVPSQGAYNSWVSSLGGQNNIERYIYGRLFGNSSSRVATSDFLNFYNSIGSGVTTTSQVKDNLSGAFSLATLTYPVLTKMGLKLDSSLNSSSGRYQMGSTDEFRNVENYGSDGSLYYITPYSCMITYIDREVLKNTLYAMLDLKVRCNRVSNLSNSSMDSADGSIATQIYPLGSSGSSVPNRNVSNHTIVNDGEVEYFLDTLDVDVTYYLVDFFDNRNRQIVNYVLGSTVGEPQYSLPQRYKNSSTKRNLDGSKPTEYWVVVAQVDVSIDLSIPYKSSILQWHRSRVSSSSDEFFGILDIDEVGNLSSSDEGLTYSYTTFTAIVE